MIQNIQFDNLGLVLFIIPIFIFLIFVIRKEFISQHTKLLSNVQKRYGRLLLIFSRTILSLLILIAISGPFTSIEKITEYDPRIMILVDNSKSMYPYNTTFVNNLQDELSMQVPTSITYFNNSKLSRNLIETSTYGNILLVSDLNDLEEPERLQQSLESLAIKNITLGLINISPEKPEASVRINAPSNALESSNIEMNIIVEKTYDDPITLKIFLDNKQIEDTTIGDGKKYAIYTIKKYLPIGFHSVSAEIIPSEDYFSQNNIYHHVIQIVKKPEINIIKNKFNSKTTFSDSILESLYNVKFHDSIPKINKDNTKTNTDNIVYGAKNKLLVFEDFNLNELSEDELLQIKSDVFNGLNLVFLGGENSFDYGDYKGSLLETILPVKIARAAEKPITDINLVMLIDISGSTIQSVEGQEAFNIEKAIAIDLIKQTREDTKIGVIAFNNKASIVQELKDLTPYDQNNLYERIALLENRGGTTMDIGIKEAIKMLSNVKGSRNIIIISDGFTTRKAMSEKYVKEALELGIKTHAVVIGENVNHRFLRNIAISGNGKFFRPDNQESIKLVFKTEDKDKDAERLPLMVLNKNHFITQKSEDVNISISGNNQIVPKDKAVQLVNTIYNQPIIVAWRYGLGKVVVIGTGDKWAKQLYSSPLLPRSINWAIGEGIQSNLTVTYGEDKVTFISKNPIAGFTKIDTNKYIMPLSLYNYSTGIHDFHGALFDVNYNEEYKRFLMNKENQDLFFSYGAYPILKESIDEMVYKAKTNSKRKIIEKNYLTKYLIYIILILYLLEIITRRLFKYKKLYS